MFVVVHHLEPSAVQTLSTLRLDDIQGQGLRDVEHHLVPFFDILQMLHLLADFKGSSLCRRAFERYGSFFVVAPRYIGLNLNGICFQSSISFPK
jgi:hypothetical protein